jgi:MFS family permease
MMSAVEKSYMGLRSRPLNMVVSIMATTGFLLFGYDQGVMSGIISARPFNEYFPDTADDDEYASVNRGFVTTIYEAGCLLGAAFILWAGDSLGRRRAVCVCNGGDEGGGW